MLLRARFFDDWRLSRIDEEVERLSINSDTSVAVDTTSPSLHPAQRSASAEGVLQSDDSDEPPLPPPPSPLPPMTPPQRKKVAELDIEHQQRLDEEAEALRFLQVKYDTLGKVKIQKRQTLTSQQPPVQTTGDDKTVTAAGPQVRLNCDCSLTSAGDERPRMAVDSNSLPQLLPSTQTSVTIRRRPPPPPSTDRDEWCCPASNRTELRDDHESVDCNRYHHHRHHHHHHHHHRQQQQQLEHFPHQQRSQTSASLSSHQPQRHQDDSGQGRMVTCSCHSDQGHGSSSTERQRCSMLSNAELFQIDLFYRSRRTLVYVCLCPAVLYFARTASGSSSIWRFAAAGVPVIVVDTLGVSVGPRLHVVLAERGTGFELWRYGLTDVDHYTVSETSTIGRDNIGGAAFHTAILPSRDVAGLCFDDADSASEFYRQLLRLTELYLTGTGSRRKKGKKKTTTPRDTPAGAHDVICYLQA